MSKLTRKETALALKRMALSYLVHQGYGCSVEVGVVAWGKRRADVIGISFKGEIVICEIKSCLADFKSDNKYHEYLSACNKMYFVFPEKFDVELPPGIGILIPGPDGYLKCVRPARRKPMVGTRKRDIILRLAFRAATFSKRTMPKRVRIHLHKANKL